MTAPAYEAADAARLRREQLEWTRAHGATNNEMMIAVGRQQLLRPPAPPAMAAHILAEEEYARLAGAELFYATPDAVELVLAAAPSMPLFAPREFDFPAETGFILFGAPVAHRALQVDEAQFARALDVSDDVIAEVLGDVEIIAASWGPWAPWEAPAAVRSAAATHGRWISLYAAGSGLAERVYRDDPAALARARAFSPPLNPENEVVLALLPDELPAGRTERNYIIPDADGTLGPWVRVVLATFQLMRQPRITETERQPVDRAERRRHVKARIPEPDGVHIVRLRGRAAEPGETGAAGESGRSLSVRFPVGPFWRNQWYPTLGAHRPKLIPQYMKGPAGAPLVGAERVRVITTPAGEAATS